MLLGNSDLTSETVESYELIWMGQWNYIHTSLGYFENHFNNAIVQVIDSGGLQQYQNVSQNAVKGFEFETSYQLNSSWLLKMSYTQMIETPDIFFKEAKKLGSLAVNYQYLQRNL